MPTAMRGGYSKKWKTPETGQPLDLPIESYPTETLPIESFPMPSLPPETLSIESAPTEAYNFKLEPMNP